MGKNNDFVYENKVLYYNLKGILFEKTLWIKYLQL
jgi:hypothetical protein